MTFWSRLTGIVAGTVTAANILQLLISVFLIVLAIVLAVKGVKTVVAAAKGDRRDEIISY